jgi:hypothetical protein
MKKMRLTIVLLIVTFGFAFCQPDKTFKEVITFEKGFNFVKDGQVQTMPFTGSSSDVTWETLAGKPLVFPPDLNVTNPLYRSASWLPTWDDVQDKPEEIELVEAILSMQGVRLPVLTTVQIDALSPAVGTLVYDNTLNVLKIYTGQWKIIITSN